MQLHDVHQGIHRRKKRKRIGRGHRLGARQDRVQGAQGPLLPPGVQAQPALRGRPDAPGPPRPQARLRQRRVQEGLRHRQPRRPRGLLRGRRRRRRGGAAGQGAGQGPARRRRQDPRRRRADQGPERPRHQVQRARPPSKIAAAGGKAVVVPYKPHAVRRQREAGSRPDRRDRIDGDASEDVDATPDRRHRPVYLETPLPIVRDLRPDPMASSAIARPIGRLSSCRSASRVVPDRRTAIADRPMRTFESLRLRPPARSRRQEETIAVDKLLTICSRSPSCGARS